MERTFSNTNIVIAIISTVFIILIGYIMSKNNIFSADFAKVLSKVVLSVALPALAFTSFMQPINTKTLSQCTNVLIWGIVMYIILIFVMNPFFRIYKTQGDRQMTLKVLSIFGSTTFFGLPIVGAVWGAKGILYGSVFNIGYRIFLLRQAKKIIDIKNINLLLLDVYLPDGKGIDFLTYLRQVNNSIAVIMITAAADRETIVQAMNNGVVDYLIKPFQLRRFEKAINKFFIMEKIPYCWSSCRLLF